MDRAGVLKSEVSRLVSEQNMHPCPHDGKPCLVPNGACEAFNFGVGLPEKMIWRCSRLPVRK